MAIVRISGTFRVPPGNSAENLLLPPGFTPLFGDWSPGAYSVVSGDPNNPWGASGGVDSYLGIHSWHFNVTSAEVGDVDLPYYIVGVSGDDEAQQVSHSFTPITNTEE